MSKRVFGIWEIRRIVDEPAVDRAVSEPASWRRGAGVVHRNYGYDNPEPPADAQPGHRPVGYQLRVAAISSGSRVMITNPGKIV